MNKFEVHAIKAAIDNLLSVMVLIKGKPVYLHLLESILVEVSGMVGCLDESVEDDEF